MLKVLRSPKVENNPSHPLPASQSELPAAKSMQLHMGKKIVRSCNFEFEYLEVKFDFQAIDLDLSTNFLKLFYN